jgi:hypothetical protein
MSKRYGTLFERFWRDIIPEPMSGCWLWDGPMDDHGYGRMRVGKTKRRLHQISYELNVGPIPAGLIVRHRCDNRICCNPDHLVLGTVIDNIRDMDKRGRRSVGVKHNAKLTEEDVRAIRADRRMKRLIAADYGISHGIVINIQRRVDWRHVL